MCGYTGLTENFRFEGHCGFGEPLSQQGFPSAARYGEVVWSWETRSGLGVSPISLLSGISQKVKPICLPICGQELFNAGQKDKIVNLGIPSPVLLIYGENCKSWHPGQLSYS